MLVVFTIIAIVAERPLLQTSITLDANDGFVAKYDDSGNGGLSTSEITDPNGMSWVCNLVESDTYMYCGFELVLDEERESGLNLSNFDQVRFWMDYQGPTQSIRLYLRNYDPRYSKPHVNDSTKYNQVEFNADLAEGGQWIELSMSDFFVANWWFQANRLPPNLALPQFDNIVVIDVQTGTRGREGRHEFTLSEIEFTGQVISSERWYQGIVGTWLGLAMLFLIVRTWRLKQELNQRQARERELMQVNQLLDSRSRTLEEKSKTDPLTGAFNRKGIEDAIALGLIERREGKPLSLVMVDVDHFKPINDHYGHAVGDQVLTGLSALVKNNIRGTDLFARWGGEEFVLVCRDTDLREAAGLAEKLRGLLEEKEFDQVGRITASFGVATLRQGETLDEIFNRVDQALYKAKEFGRNRVEVSW
ncbi:GGDEF domain-containing protein [Marinimicrobium sp. C6131]|uniref:GGDEF domain-containing protein n=1 Tax=Marinimicrobium sp. C6131 TaxID=3022676 RepID=UPI00223DF9BB|nr:GGDEF domain-containing protein [Marinimicrobium sp. C6131]UZJ44547.1 GGDEF domain-containing protein [Marinimicrobium sp. C6131]